MIKSKNIFSLKLIAVFFVVSSIFLGCASTSSKVESEKALVWDSSIKRGSLENGITYYIKKNTTPSNRITLRLVVKAGSVMEEENERGIAHLIEHMAFNGTENFEKSAIVDYFEKIGMNFGSDLNAYTSFEQTVYKLEIPADDPKILETAMLIFHDWACGITFPQEELDKERGVVTEEWRLGQGLQNRATEKQVELLLHDSAFEKRLPIGDMNVIKNVSRETLVNFYKKWYRPELISVVAVGDIDSGKMEAAIKKTMEKIPASEERYESKKLTVPNPTENKISILKDAELPYTQVFMFEPEKDFKPRETEKDLQEIIALEMAASIFEIRMNEISTMADSPWFAAGASSLSLTNWSYHNYLGVYPKAGQFTQALKRFFDEFDRFVVHGVTESELNREKEKYLASALLAYQNRNENESYSIADNIINYPLLGKIQISEEEYYRIYKKIIPLITIEQVNEAVKKAIGNRGSLMYIQGPVSEKYPSEKEIMSLWKDYKNAEISAYEDNSTDGLMKRPLQKAKIKSQKAIKELGAKEYILENGIRIITKKTNYEHNFVRMNVLSKGGLYYLDDEDVPSSGMVPGYVLYSGFENLTYNQLVKEISSKQINFYLNIDNTIEYFTSSFSEPYTEEALQLVNLFFTQVKFNDGSWQALLQQNKEIAASHGNKPDDVFNDKIRELLYGKNNIYYAPFDLNYVSKMDSKKAEKIYRERFANPADFTYVFTGDFNETKLLEYCQLYLGNLKTSDEREETIYKLWKFPEGKQTATVKKGQDEKGKVFIAFGGELPEEKDVEKSYKEKKILSYLTYLLEIRLREVIREDKSGSYGVSVNGSINGNKDRNYKVIISFGCEPSRAEELRDEVLEQIVLLQKNPAGQNYLEKLIETEKRGSENNIYDNGWWMERINSELIFNTEPVWVSKNDKKTEVEWITAENILEAAKKYLNVENYVSVYLKPEK